MPTLTSDSSLRERTAYYRAKAEDALERAAAAADPSVRDGLLDLAAGWHGLARELSLPAGDDAFTSSMLKSYRLRNGVLHNPKADRRTTVREYCRT